MIYTPIVEETHHVYDVGTIHLYKVRWHRETDCYTLQRRKKPTDPERRYNLWGRMMEVDNYIELKEFDPSPYVRPVMKFTSLEEVEKVIRDDAAVTGPIPEPWE